MINNTHYIFTLKPGYLVKDLGTITELVIEAIRKKNQGRDRRKKRQSKERKTKGGRVKQHTRMSIVRSLTSLPQPT